ncbi:uncharacterized protein BDZ99DRAFT_499181 [Mytilinidion resinicola]|uniref:Uncharacterized protein n=1 Tax=Mytilinidion resinicola TaxID=574789 RepID=A0A6A6YIU2_9PEZI|nr:uncharacterized protein BDZ99DRAFT_499181 [Mytilinidion resinicola]KAF2808776.1 hypothetical protein BDZ99DRAFT_499181 [Mytilinidion resinicola]
MAYSHENRYHSGRHESYYQQPRQHDIYSSSPTSHYDMPAAHSYSYDPRYSYSTLPPRSPAYPPRPDPRKKPRWPPSPSVENEIDSLAKELRGVGLEDESSGEARSRGTVDQEPIMLEVEQPKSDLNDERRFVLVPGHGTDKPGPRDNRRRSFAERGNMPHLKTDIHQPSIPLRREPSPYTISKPTKENPSRTSAEYFLSPETLTPQASSIPRSVPKGEAREYYKDQNSKPEKSAQPQHRRYDSAQSPRTSHLDIFDDSDLDNDDSAHLRAERRPARYSFVKEDLQKEDLSTSLNGPGKDPRTSPRSSNPRLPNEHSSSGSSGSSKTSTAPPSPRSSNSNLHNVSAPRQIPQSKNPPVETPYARSPRRFQDPQSRPGSPLVKEKPWPQSPPRSPTLAQSNFRDSPPRTKPVSRPSSRPASRAGSPISFLHTTSMPPPSPKPLDANDVDWHSTFPPVTRNERRDEPRPSSRHTKQPSMIVPPRIDVQSPSPARPPKPASTLPYPVDDLPGETFMPSVEQYQFQPNSAQYMTPIPTATAAFPRSPVTSSPTVSRSRDEKVSSRPLVTSRHSAAEEVPRLARVRANSNRSSSAYDGRRVDKAPAPLSLDKPLPSCPRLAFSSNFNDWYTLENCPNFDVCPTCYEGVFEDTQFAPYFKQTRVHEKRILRNCDFSSPWVRLAWLLMVKQKHKSLDLLYRLATIREIEQPCPGNLEISGTWYGIKDSYGDHVTKFAICPCDLKQIEALLPSLRGAFTRIYPSDSRKTYMCALRTASRRFPAYLDLLVELDEEATRRARSPDLRPFIQLAKENAYKQECTRDQLILDQTWHFIPRLPEFAVCEECFDELVWPEAMKKNPSKIAAEFNKSLQFVKGEPTLGTSCQLYSPRMRRVWKRAVEDEDFGYLAKKALERNKMEIDLQSQSKAIARLLGDKWRSGVEREQLRLQAAQLAEAWREWE